MRVVRYHEHSRLCAVNPDEKIKESSFARRTMEPPSRHINGWICPLKSADKLTNMSIRIQDKTYFTLFFADDSGIKSCHLFLLF